MYDKTSLSQYRCEPSMKHTQHSYAEGILSLLVNVFIFNVLSKASKPKKKLPGHYENATTTTL
jgi:hypothetical protein